MSASGFTKRMDKELLAQLGLNEDSADDDSSEENSGDDDIEGLREQVEVSMKFEKGIVEGIEIVMNDKKCTKEDRIEADKVEISKESNSTIDENSVPEVTSLKETVTNNDQSHSHHSKEPCGRIDNTKESDAAEHNINDARSTIADELEFHFDSRSLADDRFDSRSITSASTIPPEVIRARVKSALEKRERTKVRVRNLAKGEASATSRNRRDNRQTIQESVGCTMWGD